MDDQTKRMLLFWGIAFVAMMFFLQKPPAPEQESPAERPPAAREEGRTPTPGLEAGDPQAPEPLESEEQGEEVAVETATYRVVFDTAGAHPVRWQVVDPRFAKVAGDDVETAKEAGGALPKVGDFKPIELIPDYPGLDETREYPLMTVLKESAGPFHREFNRRVYEVDGPRTDDAGATVVRFVSPVNAEGLQLTKTFRFPAEGYLVDLDVSLEVLDVPGAQNLSFADAMRPGLGMTWGPGVERAEYRDRWGRRSYGLAVWNGEELRNADFNDWEDVSEGDTVEQVFPGGQQWAALDSLYYMAAVAPREGTALVRGIVRPQHVPGDAQARKEMTPPATLEVYSGDLTLRIGESRTLRYRLFAGPKQRDLLVSIDERTGLGLQEMMFHQTMWLLRVLAVFMLWMMNHFYAWFGNYGWAIILLVIVMRLLTQPFTHMGMKSQAHATAELKRIKPLLTAINEKYKDDPQKKQAEIMKTYREHGVNPFGMMKGCVWLIVQMPIFFAMYRLLNGAIDLRGASFLWIDDLTAPDALFSLPVALPLLGASFNLLPIMMAGSQLIAQRLQSANIDDPTQKQMMYLMPIIFMFFLYNMPAGLNLYWFVSNLWQIAFQVFVNKRVREEAERKAHHAFEERRKAVAEGRPAPGRKSAKSGPTWRQRLMKRLEEKAKEAQKVQEERIREMQRKKKGGKRK